MRLAGEELTEMQKCVVLQYDEMKLKSVLEFDNAEDEIVGPYNYPYKLYAGYYEQWVKTVFKPFMSINSLKILSDDMNQKFSASYILTHRLNQDSLENFFFQVRSGGGVYDHPSPLDALSRVKMIILGKNPGILESHTCTEDQQQDEYMVAQMFHRANVSINSSSTINDNSENGSSSSSSKSQEQMNPATVIDNGPETTGDALECIRGYIAKKY
ncbi:hypothetical protein JTB14_024861 [Gonioctena quinquepunctata]|nr:hypothetical protein JTB14_024861 [Gonioctena quinquepunctata]